MDSSGASSTTMITSASSSSSFSASSSKGTANGAKNSSSTLAASSSGRVTHVEDITDENLLREMWVEASDGESKRQIRSRMYKLREERLKDFYNREGILENILKEEHTESNAVAVVGEKPEAVESCNGKNNGSVNGNGNTTATSSKTVTTVVGSANGERGAGGVITTTTTRTTSSTLTSGDNSLSHDNDNDDGIKDLKSRVNQQKEKLSLSRKQSQEQQAKIQTTAQKVKSTSASTTATSSSSVVTRKNSDLFESGNGTGNGNTDLSELKSKQCTITTKAHGNVKSSVQRVDSNKLNEINGKTSGSGHSEIIRRSSQNNESSSNARNGGVKAEHKNGSSVTTSSTKVEIKSRLSSSGNGQGQSNKNDKPPLVKKNSSTWHKEDVQRTASGSAIRTSVTRTSSSTTSTANSIKLAKGLHSPPVTKKETKVEVVPAKSTGGTPRFMSTTKSREIGIASTQQQFPTINVNVVHRQDSGKGSSKVSVAVTKSLSNGSAKQVKEKPLLTPKHSTGAEGRVSKSRESSPKSFHSLKKGKEEKVAEKASTPKVNTSTNKAVIKKDVAIKTTSTASAASSNRTDESIIRELDNLDNYLYQRSKSIEEKKARSPTPSATIIGGERSGEITSQRKQQQHLYVEKSKSSITSLDSTAKIDTKQNSSGGKSKPKRNNSGGTHAKQIEADENDASMNKGSSWRRSHSPANNATSGAVDVMVSGLEPKVTKSKAYSHCTSTTVAAKSNVVTDSVDGDIHEMRKKQAKGHSSSNNAERRERNDETKSNTKSNGSIEMEKVKGEQLLLVSSLSSFSSSNNESKQHIKSEETRSKTARYKTSGQTDEMAETQAETQTAIPTGTIETKREERTEQSNGSTSTRLWSDTKMQSQQEKYDADILSRPSVFDKKKSSESGPVGLGRGKAAGQTLAKEKENESKSTSRVEKQKKVSSEVEHCQQKITSKESRKDYNDNEKKKQENVVVGNTARPPPVADDDEDEDDNPLKPERRFSGQRRNLESPGAVLKAKSLFENKAHEASLDKASGGFTLSPGTTFKVNRKAAIFEAKSRGERVSISSESSSHVDGVNESGNEMTQKIIGNALVENVNTSCESKTSTVKATKSNVEINAETPVKLSTADVPRRRSSADVLEAIENIDQLEAMLYQATDYDERSRIRARIRIIKRQTNLGKATGKAESKDKASVSVKKTASGHATMNEESAAFTSTKKSYVSRKSSEEIKTRKSASRKSSGETSVTKENGGVSIVAVEAKRTVKATRNLSGEIKRKNSEPHVEEQSSRPGSPRKDSCFERLYSTSTVSSANMFSEASANNHPHKPSGSSGASPKSLSRKSSEKEEVAEPEKVSKPRHRSSKGGVTKLNERESVLSTTLASISSVTGIKSEKRQRNSSNKSTGSCCAEVHTPVIEIEVVKQLRRSPSTEKNARRSPGRVEDGEILSLDQLKDIQTKLREKASAERENASAVRRASIKKDETEKRERRLSKKDSIGTSSASEHHESHTARKISAEEKETSSERKRYTTRRTSSKELKVTAAETQPAPEKAKTPERKKSGDDKKQATASSSGKTTTEANTTSVMTSTKTVGSTGYNSGRRPSNGYNGNKKSALPIATETNTNSVTSSYGVGPVDDDGTPLFGLRALRKIKHTKNEQDVTVEKVETAPQQLTSKANEGHVDMRRSNLYGLRALKKNHETETSNSEDAHFTTSSNKSETVTSTALNSSRSNATTTTASQPIDSAVAEELPKRSPEPSESETKQSSPTPPPTAMSPKSILKKTSSFSSNKSESKPDLNTEQTQSHETNKITSTYSASRLDSPSTLHSTRSRSSSSDDDWKRKSPETHGSNSMTNLSSNALSNFASFSRGRVGHSSVKEMSKRFEKTEASVDGVVSSKAEHSTRHVLGGPNKDFISGVEAEPEDIERGNVVYTKHSRIQKVELKDSDENDEYEDQFKEEIGGEEHEENGTLVKVTKNTKTTRSFLSDHSPAKNLADVLERMKGEQQGQGEEVEKGESEAAGRNLLNKFLGAQILLTSMEPLMKAGAEDSDVDCRTTTTATMSHSLVINGVDIDQESDSDKLRRLLEDCDGAEERGRIERRLRTLGSSVAESGVSQSVTSSSKMVRTSSKQSSASADVTGELMPLILGQLENSLHNLNNSGSSNSLSAAGGVVDEPGLGNAVVGGGGGGGTAKTQSSCSVLDAGSGANSLCNSNNNSTATLVVQTPGAEGDGGGGSGSGAGSGGSPDEDECLFDSGTESGEDAPPVSSTNRSQPPPSSSLSMLSSSSTSSNAATNPKKQQTTRKKSDPQSTAAAAGEFTSFMEGLRHSLQQSASALVLSSSPPSSSGREQQQHRKGKGISIGGGRTSTGGLPSNLISASEPTTPTDSDLIQQVDSVLSLLKESLVKDPNYLEKKLSSSIAVDSRKGKELIALIDRLKSSLQNTKQEISTDVSVDANKSDTKTATDTKWEEPQPPDLLLPVSQELLTSAENKATKSEQEKEKQSQEKKGPEANLEAGRKQPPKPPTSLMDEVPWKIRAAKKRTQGRSRSIGVSHEELEEARRLLQEEAFRSALKSEERPTGGNEKAGSSGQSGQPVRLVPGFRPMSWRSDSGRPAGASGGGDSDPATVTLDDATALLWSKFGVFKPHKPFRTLSLDNQANNNLGEADYDPSSILFTPQEVAQIAIHRAAINKQMSEEEDRRRRRNSLSSLAALDGDAEAPSSPNKPRDFSLALPKPYSNPNIVSPGPRSTPQVPVSVSVTSKSSTPNPGTTTDDEHGQMFLYDTSSTRSTPIPQSPTKRSNIDNVQISLKELTTNMFPQLQIAITLNTNNGNGGQQQHSGSTVSTPPTPTNTVNMMSIAGPSGGSMSSAPSARIVTATPTSSSGIGDSSMKGNVSSGSSSGNSGGIRYKNKSERKRRLKRANTIDIPQPYDGGNESDEEGDGEDEDDEPGTPKFSPTKPNLMSGQFKDSADTSSSPARNFGFIPKTESDKKFYAFLEKNNENLSTKGVGRFNRPLSHLAVPDDHRTSHFSNLKTSFESSTSQGSSPSMSPIPLSPSAKQYSNKPIWAARSDALVRKSPQSVRNKLSVFENVDSTSSSPVPTQDHWKPGSSDTGQTKIGYQPQTKPSSLLAKKESYEKFAEEHAQAQQVIQRRPVPIARTKVRNLPKILAPEPDSEPPPLPPPPLPPKTGGREGVHIVHATKSAMDALARQRSNFSPVLPTMSSADQPPMIPPRASHTQFKSLPSSPTVEKPEMQWQRGPIEPSRTPVPPYSAPKVQMSRELFESKQREAVLTPVPHPPPTSHFNVTVPLHQQQKSFVRLDLPSNDSRPFEDDGVPLTGRSPFIAVKKMIGQKPQSFPASRVIEHQSSHSPSPGGQVEKVSVVFQPIVHGKSLDSTASPYSQQGNLSSQGLHPKLAVFGVTRSIDDERVVKGRLELESNKQTSRRDSTDENYGGRGIVNTAFEPSKTSAFVARRFEGKNLEPLPHLRRQSTPVTSSDGQLSPGSPATLISPVVSKVMKGPQQQRATVTRKEMSSLGSDHPSAHRIRGESGAGASATSGGNMPATNYQSTDTARFNIKSILDQFQQAEGTSAQTKAQNNQKPASNPARVFPRQGTMPGVASNTLAPSLPLKKSHSGDALMQTHFGPILSHHHQSGRTSHFMPSAIQQEQEEPVPLGQTGKFQPFQSHGFVQARSRFLEQQQAPIQTQPQQQPQKPAASSQAPPKSWVPQVFAGAMGPSSSSTASNPFIPRQRSLSHFPPSTPQPSSQSKPLASAIVQQKPTKPLVLGSYASTSAPSIASRSPPTNVNRIRFPPEQSKSLQRDDDKVDEEPSPSVQEIVEQLQRTSSGSSIFDRTKSLYISTQDAMGGGPKPRRKPPPSALPKSKTLFPKQYEAQMSPTSAEKKQRELEAFFKMNTPAEVKPKATAATTSASSHYRKLRHQKSHEGNEGSSSPSYTTRIRKSASQGKIMGRQRSTSDGEEDVDQIFESLFHSAVESKMGKGGGAMTTVTASAVESKKQQQSEAQCQVQRQASASSVQSSGADGSTSTKTVKQQSTKSSTSFKSASSSSTASATASVSTSASPFSKFKQLDQQNSPTTAAASSKGGGGGPIFKFTNEALKSSATSAKDVLLYWSQCRVRDYQNVKIENFSSSWSDGLAFCALIHHFYPDAFDYSKLDAKNRRYNFELAFRVAEEKADIYPLLDVEDMMVMGKRPDWKCVFTYVQSMYRKLKDS